MNADKLMGKEEARETIVGEEEKAVAKLMGEDGRLKVREAIAGAEEKTTAEIVCALATESGRYDRGESLAGLFVGLVAVLLAHAARLYLQPEGSWGELPALDPLWQVLIVLGGFIAGTLLAGFFPRLRGLFVLDREEEEEVARSAAFVFATAGMTTTAGRTGLLVYISLRERRLVILADETVLGAVGAEGLEGLKDNAAELLTEGKFTDAFVKVVEDAGAKLAESLPASREINPDELDNHVLFFHPRP